MRWKFLVPVKCSIVSLLYLFMSHCSTTTICGCVSPGTSCVLGVWPEETAGLSWLIPFGPTDGYKPIPQLSEASAPWP